MWPSSTQWSSRRGPPGCGRRRGRSRPRSRRRAGRRSGRCAASPARSAPAARSVPHWAMAGATSCWVTENISVRRGTSNAVFLVPEGERVGHRQAAAAVLLGPGQRAPARVVLRLLVGADPVGLRALLLGGPVLEDGDGVRSRRPTGLPSAASATDDSHAWRRAANSSSDRVRVTGLRWRSSWSSQTASTVQALMPGAP